MRSIQTLAELASLTGEEVGVSDWVLITQERVQLFADATGDHQWIHVDIKRANAGPFGGPIVHGFLTLSLIPEFFSSALRIVEPTMGVNYGLNKVRFTSPVRVGSRLRGRLRLVSCTPISNRGFQCVWEVKVECEGIENAACIAESITLRFPLEKN